MYHCRKTEISLLHGDITGVEVDAIVNAANRSLSGGGGVDGAIHRAAGPALAEACRNYTSVNGPIETGAAITTAAGKLPAKAVIHTAGPVYSNAPQDPLLLAACYRNALQEAVDHNFRSVAFPAVSTGVYGYPKKPAAAIAVRTVMEFINAHPEALDRVIFVLFSRDALNIYRKLLPEYCPE